MKQVVTAAEMHRGARQNACPDVTQYSRKAEKEKSVVNQDEGMKLRSQGMPCRRLRDVLERLETLASLPHLDLLQNKQE